MPRSKKISDTLLANTTMAIQSTHLVKPNAERGVLGGGIRGINVGPPEMQLGELAPGTVA